MLEKKLELADHEKNKCSICKKEFGEEIQPEPQKPVQENRSQTRKLSQNENQSNQTNQKPTKTSSTPSKSSWGFTLPSISSSTIMDKLKQTVSAIEDLQFDDSDEEEEEEETCFFLSFLKINFS